MCSPKSRSRMVAAFILIPGGFAILEANQVTSFSGELLEFAALLDTAVEITPHLKRRAHALARQAAEHYTALRYPGGLPAHAMPAERETSVVLSTDAAEIYLSIAKALGGAFGRRRLSGVAKQLRKVMLAH